MRRSEQSADNQTIPRIRAGIKVTNATGRVMEVIAANQQKGIACCIYDDDYGRRVEEYCKLSELLPT